MSMSKLSVSAAKSIDIFDNLTLLFHFDYSGPVTGCNAA